MVKIKKTWLVVLTAIAMSFAAIFGIMQAKTNGITAFADTPTVTCQGIANAENNNVLESGATPKYRTLLKYDIALGAAANDTNVVSTTGQGVFLNGVALSEIDNASIDYAHGGGYIQIRIPKDYQDALDGDIVLEVIAGTTFENAVLDGAKFVLRSDKWKTLSNATFNRIRWDNTDYNNYDGKKGVLLQFNEYLSTVQTEIGGGLKSTNLASTVGEHIYLGGAKLSTLSGALVSYMSQGNMFIYADNMTAYRTLTIEAGTVMVERSLPEINIYCTSNSWSTTAKSYTDVTFSSLNVSWNDGGYDPFAGKHGVLINFSANLSNVQTESDGGLQSTVNFASTVGEHIYVGGVKLSTLSGALVSYHSANKIYLCADNMSTFRTITIEAGTKILDSSLPELNLYYNLSSKWTTTAQTSFTSVTFSGIQWNNVGYGDFAGKNGVLLNYSANLSQLARESGGGSHTTNLVKTPIGDKIKLGGTALADIADAEINYHSENKLWIYAPNMATLGNLTIETTNFLDATLPDLELTFNGTQWGLATVCQGIANAANNNILESGATPKYRTLLRYNKTLGASSNPTNVVSSAGNGILLNGVALSEISGSSIDYAHGGGYIQIRIPQSYQDALDGDIVLEVVAGTTFENAILGGMKFILRDRTWKTLSSVTYSGIQWNDAGYNYYAAMKGVLLNFSANLSTVADEVNANIQSTNFASTVGEHIYLGGVKLSTLSGAVVSYHSQNKMFIYADNMWTYRTLTIENGTIMLDSVLPEVKLYFNLSSKWTTTAQTSFTSVTFSSIQWNNVGYGDFADKNGVLLNFSANLSQLARESDGGSQTTNLVETPIGSKIKLGGTALKDITGAEINYHSASKLWIYAPSMTTLGNLTIETTNFLDATLPSLTLYFYDDIWNTTPAKYLTINYTAGDVSIDRRIYTSITVNSDYLTDVLSEEYEHAIVLGWSIGETDYFYGDSSSVSATTTVNITNILDFYTQSGASIRLSQDGITGLRFGSRITNESYNALYENYEDVELGTYIAPKSMLDNYLAENSERTFKDYFAEAQGSGSSSKYVKVVNQGIFNRDTYESDGYVQFCGSLGNIRETNYYKTFVGVGYVKFVKGGNTYVLFGANNLKSNTRTVYDVAKAAYNDTNTNYTSAQLNVIKIFIDAVADFTYRQGVLSENVVITERAYSSPYLTSHNNGYYYIAKYGSEEVPKTILINGKRVSPTHFGSAANNGSIVLNISDTNMSNIFADGLNYGVGEPDSNLWANGNTVATASMLSDITGAMNATAFRIWMSDQASINSSNTVSLVTAKMTELRTLINGLAANGVNEIYIVGQHFPSGSYENYYVDDVGWVTASDYYTNYNRDSFYLDYFCVPDPSTEAAAYAEWLKVQYDYYNLLTAQIAAWKEVSPAWNGIKFYFEGLNEPEGQGVIHKRGTYSAGTYTYNYFNNTTLAKILTDVAYYMTLAVNDNLGITGYVTTPALTYLDSDSGQVPDSGTSADGLLSSMATAIKDNVAPTAISGITPTNTNDPEDYFTVLNWHPYLIWVWNQHNELYYSKYEGGVWGVNSDYPNDWVNWNNNLYYVFVGEFEYYAPKVVFTEIGMIDYGDYRNYSGNSDIKATFDIFDAVGVNESLAAIVFGKLLSAVGNLTFADNCTIIAFRLCDVESIFRSDYADVNGDGDYDMYIYGEGNLGLIEEDGTVKAIMEKYYYIINGNRDTTALQTVVSGYYD